MELTTHKWVNLILKNNLPNESLSPPNESLTHGRVIFLLYGGNDTYPYIKSNISTKQ